ncbi:hypothetical protein IFM46972_08385 [Aspergillus udagawae]|uniref:Uncharacterized protein n=1 Tax=Aspergillus udagawae TaxID=91492 RepID=A0A8H3P7R9_9EURO|nr:hypothetical protein IFM46972_08385 [Aspergillus udagawae]
MIPKTQARRSAFTSPSTSPFPPTSPNPLLVTRHPMHETMARPTQPRHTIQHPLLMPPLLEHLCMHAARNQMVIREGDPVALADLAGVGARGRPYRRRGGHTGYVLAQHWGEEVGDVGGVGHEAVDGEGVGDGDGDGSCYGLEEGAGERGGGVFVCEDGVVLDG